MALWTTGDDSSVFERLLTEYISSPAALRRCLAAVTIQRWAESSKDRGMALAQTSTSAQALAAQLIGILESPTPATYTEMAVMLQRIQADCQALYSTAARDLKIARASVPELPSKVDATGASAGAFTIETAKHVAGAGLDALLALSTLSKAKLETGTTAAEERRHRLVVAIGFYATQKEQQDNQLLASVAGAVVALGTLPAKLNPVIRSLMNAVKVSLSVKGSLRFSDPSSAVRREPRAADARSRLGGQSHPAVQRAWRAHEPLRQDRQESLRLRLPGHEQHTHLRQHQGAPGRHPLAR